MFRVPLPVVGATAGRTGWTTSGPGVVGGVASGQDQCCPVWISQSGAYYQPEIDDATARRWADEIERVLREAQRQRPELRVATIEKVPGGLRCIPERCGPAHAMLRQIQARVESRLRQTGRPLAPGDVRELASSGVPAYETRAVGGQTVGCGIGSDCDCWNEQLARPQDLSLVEAVLRQHGCRYAVWRDGASVRIYWRDDNGSPCWAVGDMIRQSMPGMFVQQARVLCKLRCPADVGRELCGSAGTTGGTTPALIPVQMAPGCAAPWPSRPRRRIDLTTGGQRPGGTVGCGADHEGRCCCYSFVVQERALPKAQQVLQRHGVPFSVSQGVDVSVPADGHDRRLVKRQATFITLRQFGGFGSPRNRTVGDAERRQEAALRELGPMLTLPSMVPMCRVDCPPDLARQLCGDTGTTSGRGPAA